MELITFYYILAILGAIALAFLIVVLWKVIMTLTKVNLLLDEAQATVEHVQTFVAKPMKMVLQVVDQFQGILCFFGNKRKKD